MAIHRFVRMILSGEEIPLYGIGESSRDYTYVDDIVEGTVQALFRPEKFAIYNLGSTSPISLRELVRSIEQAVVPVHVTRDY